MVNKNTMFQYLRQIALVMLVMVIATLLDGVVHSLRAEFYVPFSYYTNKVLFGAFRWVVALLFLQKVVYQRDPARLALRMSLFIAIVLQAKYFFQGYDLFFVFFLWSFTLSAFGFQLGYFSKYGVDHFHYKKIPRNFEGGIWHIK